MHEGAPDVPDEVSFYPNGRDLTFKDSVNLTSYAIVLVVVSWFMGFYWAKEHPDKFTLSSLHRWLRRAPTSSTSFASTAFTASAASAASAASTDKSVEKSSDLTASSMKMEFHEITTSEIHTDEHLKEVVEKHREIPVALSSRASTSTVSNENFQEQLTLEKALDPKFFKKISPKYLKLNDETRISLEVREIFSPGRATIQSEYQSDLNHLVDTIMAKVGEGYIDVESYTDLTPVIKNKRFYPTNWELSSARAATFLRVFVDRGFAKEKIRLIGYGPTQRRGASRSLASTDPVERRIEFVLR